MKGPIGEAEGPYRTDHLLKNMYRQQLDELMAQKEEQKRIEREKLEMEKAEYNQRVNYNKEAERMKDLSYKNVTLPKLSTIRRYWIIKIPLRAIILSSISSVIISRKNSLKRDFNKRNSEVNNGGNHNKSVLIVCAEIIGKIWITNWMKNILWRLKKIRVE